MHIAVNSTTYFTRGRIVFWCVMTSILAGVATMWTVELVRHPQRSSIGERAACIMNLRNLQQAVRAYQNVHDLKPGDPIPWDELIGPEKFIESIPRCPILGPGAYQYSKVIPDPGVLAAPCQNLEHRPNGIEGW